jgi:hypothetical protein
VVEGKDELGEVAPVHGEYFRPDNLRSTTHSGKLLDTISQCAALRVGSEISYPSVCSFAGVPDRRLCLDRSAVLASATSARGLPAKGESCLPCSGSHPLGAGGLLDRGPGTPPQYCPAWWRLDRRQVQASICGRQRLRPRTLELLRFQSPRTIQTESTRSQ